jgi:hypothetical protein
MGAGVTGVAPEPAPRAGDRALAGGLDDWRDITATLTEPWNRTTGRAFEGNPRIRIDPNVRVRGNQTFSTFDDCDRIPAVGDQVTAYEDEDGIEGPAVCTGIDEDKRLVYLRVDWSALLPI